MNASRISRPASVRMGMFCRFGSVDESLPVAAMVWLNVVWIRSSAATDFSSPSTVTLSRVASRWASRCSRNGWAVLSNSDLQGISVGGVTGLGAFGLRHAELVEQHHLQLLGRAEVDLLADHFVGRVGGDPDLLTEFALQGCRACPDPPRSRQFPSRPGSPYAPAAPSGPAEADESMRSSSASSASARSATARARRITVWTAWSSTPSLSSSSESCCCSGSVGRAARGVSSAGTGHRERSCADPAAPGTPPGRYRT